MFKKLKDKLTEEVKIPSQKFTQSMQQLAQAVVSPGSNNNSAAFDTASNDNFSIDGDFDDTPQASPVKSPSSEGGVAYRGGQATPLRNSFDGAGFTHVDLQQDTSTPKMPASLRSSVSSLASDSSFMFPVLESSGPTYNFQSDLESCSEASESVGPNINKEQLLVAYQKIQQKYHKYKGRYSDLARHYRDLERDNKNAKHILTDCQDKALRRMAELKEQCNLEKQAKAHLEEALRSDLEEKDHLIHTLKTKYCDAELQIKLLRNQADQVQGGQPDEKSSAGESSEASDENSTKSTVQEDLLTGADSGPGPTTPVTVLTPEPANSDDSALKEKVKKLESLLHKCKEDITNKRETIKQLESDKITAHSKLEAMLQQLAALKKREEEASLSLAKNKQTIHQELESKEDEIKKLNAQLTSTNTRVSELQAEIAQIREDSKKEVATCKMQATKQMKTELDGILAQKKTLEECLETRESEHKAQEEKISELMKRLVEHEAELQLLKAAYKANEEKHSEETKILNEEILKLQDCQKIGAGQENNVEKFKEILKTIQELHGIHKQLKTDVSKTQVDNMDLIRQQAQLIQDKIGTVMSDLTEEHKKVLVELDEYKKESVSARESLASVSNKFERLQQSLQTEKGEIEKKMSNLKKELDTNKTQISSLEENLASERSNHQVTQSEYSKKMAALQKELNDEKNRNNEFLEGTSSVELQMKSSIDELNNQVKLLEEEKVKIAGDYESMKERTNTLQITNDQLHQELEILKTQERESINKMTSMQMLVDEKNALLETLESSIEELELKAASLTAEKLELEEKWTVQEAELASQISQISSKYQKATDTIKDLQDKMSHAAGENDEKYTSLLQENEKRESQLAELQTRLQNSDAEVAQTISKNAELQKQINDLLQKFQDQDSIMTTLKETNETLSQSVQQLQDDHQVKAVRIKDLESSSAELERITSEKLQQSGDIARFEKDLAVKTKECTDIRESLESANAACSELKELLSSKSKECNDLTLEINRLTLAHSEEIKALQEKSDNCARLTSELESSEVAKSQLRSSLEQKIEECERLQTQLFEMDKKQVKDSEEHAVIVREAK
ncbi:hypothetical protein ONE63_006300 [Megalurothrips usitatus]|uniref:Golgin subfamily A member 4 n=1 Tax=Megalurothrips usitatus TaxID=439358 RepID=A0AAV7XVI8_9NEOP|nr:hypothetical protein ONE63_006300 [Megalurothrips usitatus]